MGCHTRYVKRLTQFRVISPWNKDLEVQRQGKGNTETKHANSALWLDYSPQTDSSKAQNISFLTFVNFNKIFLLLCASDFRIFALFCPKTRPKKKKKKKKS